MMSALPCEMHANGLHKKPLLACACITAHALEYCMLICEPDVKWSITDGTREERKKRSNQQTQEC